MANKEDIANLEELGKEEEAIQKEIDTLFKRKSEIQYKMVEIASEIRDKEIRDNLKNLNIKIDDKFLKTDDDSLNIVEVVDIDLDFTIGKVKIYDIDPKDMLKGTSTKIYYRNNLDLIDMVKDFSNKKMYKKITEEEFEKYKYYILNPEEYFKEEK